MCWRGRGRGGRGGGGGGGAAPPSGARPRRCWGRGGGGGGGGSPVSPAGGGGLQPRLWRPAGADLRDGGLGAGLRLLRDRGGERNKIFAGVPRLHAGDGVGLLWALAGGRARGRDEPADVQFVSRRHEVR